MEQPDENRADQSTFHCSKLVLDPISRMQMGSKEEQGPVRAFDSSGNRLARKLLRSASPAIRIYYHPYLFLAHTPPLFDFFRHFYLRRIFLGSSVARGRNITRLHEASVYSRFTIQRSPKLKHVLRCRDARDILPFSKGSSSRENSNTSHSAARKFIN